MEAEDIKTEQLPSDGSGEQTTIPAEAPEKASSLFEEPKITIEPETPPKKRGGRRKKASAEPSESVVKKRGAKVKQAITESAKALTARERAALMKPVLIIQYQEIEANADDLIEAVKADFKKSKPKTPITDLKIYVKPEERAAYYVINETVTGKVTI